MPGTQYTAGNAPARRRQARTAGTTDNWTPLSTPYQPQLRGTSATSPGQGGGGRILNMFANFASRSSLFGPIAAGMAARRRGG